MSKENQIEETYIVNNEQIEEMANFLWKNTLIHTEDLCHDVSETCYNAGYRKIPQNIGEFSDGYHTFNELYHHRAVLFSVICNMFPEKSWKSKLHDTGDMYEGMFIVGIETEQGQATYHYDIEPYWDMFKVKELEKAPKYDGHTPSDAIKRIGNLTCAGYRKQSEGEWIIKNSPFEMLNVAFKRLFPNVKYTAYFEPNIRDDADGDKVCGLTDFAEDGEITIFIDTDLTINNAVEIFAHELAHAGVGVGHEHDEVWEKAFDDLFNEYNKLGEEMFSSHINAPKGLDYINDLAKMNGGAE